MSWGKVQTAKLFDDDKYFVDMKLRAAPGKSSLWKYSCLFSAHSTLWLFSFFWLPFRYRHCFVSFSQSQMNHRAWLLSHGLHLTGVTSETQSFSSNESGHNAACTVDANCNFTCRPQFLKYNLNWLLPDPCWRKRPPSRYIPHILSLIVPGGCFRELYYWWESDSSCLCSCESES